MSLLESLSASNVVGSDIPLTTSFEQILGIEPAQAGIFAIRGVVRYSCSDPGNCIALNFESTPESTTLEVKGEHETGHNLDRDFWYHADNIMTGYLPQGVETANLVYIVNFSGVVSTEDSTPTIRVNARAMTVNGVVTALAGSFIEATLVT